MQPDAHYSDFHWVEYLHGRIPQPEMPKMEEHLTVCEDCRTRLNICRAMHTADSLTGTDIELRSTVIQERQLSFESTGYIVSVLLETSNTVLKGIVGQLSRKGTDLPGGGLKGVTAELRVNDKIYRTDMTEFGEFLFRVNEHLDGNPIELRFAMKEEPCLALLIPC